MTSLLFIEMNHRYIWSKQELLENVRRYPLSDLHLEFDCSMEYQCEDT